MDYADQTGAPMLVVTDADRYEIYDRRRGLDLPTGRDRTSGGDQVVSFRLVSILLTPCRLDGNIEA